MKYDLEKAEESLFVRANDWLSRLQLPAIQQAEKQLVDAGIECVNPVHICKKYKEEHVLADKAVFDKMIAEQQEAERGCDAILLLDGWQMSKGVRLELKTALEMGMQIFLEEDLDICGGRLCSRI